MKVKNIIGVHIDKNALVDEGDGVISFPNGFTITDGSEQRNGTNYDVPTGDITKFNGTVTADHDGTVKSIVAEAIGTMKESGRVLVQALRFAVNESAYGRLCYDLMRNGFLKDASTETIGPYPTSDNTWRNWELTGLSLIPYGNNRSATVNQIALNSIEQARKDGLDTSEVESVLKEFEPEPPAPQPEPMPEPEPTPKKEENTVTKQDKHEMLFKTVPNSRDFAIKVKYKNAAGNEIETELAPGATVDVSDDQEAAVANQISSAEAPKPDFKADIAEAVNAALGPVTEKLAEIEKKQFNAQAHAPEPKPAPAGSGPAVLKNDLDSLTTPELFKVHLAAVAGAVLGGSVTAMQDLEKINQRNLDKLKEAGKVDNAISLTDLGNFVIGPEYLPGVIVNQDSNYAPVLEAFPFEETLSLDTAWLEQVGRIRMEDVEMEDDGADGDLKPISTFTTTDHTARLKEFAAVTPISAATIRFAAVDIVGMLNREYRRAYNAALVESVIGRLVKAVQANGQVVPFDYSSDPVEALIALTAAYEKIAEFDPNGKILLTQQSRIQLFNFQLRAKATGAPVGDLFANGPDGKSAFLDRPYIIVPSEFMPKLNSAQTKSWTFEGTSVTNNLGLITADPEAFFGRVSGGLSYDVSRDASYEEGGVTKSAFQRDKLVFRGYGYRKSAVTQTNAVAGVSAPGIS